MKISYSHIKTPVPVLYVESYKSEDFTNPYTNKSYCIVKITPVVGDYTHYYLCNASEKLVEDLYRNSLMLNSIINFNNRTEKAAIQALERLLVTLW